jgi:hypothetical protein
LIFSPESLEIESHALKSLKDLAFGVIISIISGVNRFPFAL